MSEEISLGDRLQIHFLEMNSSEKHNVLGPVYAHLVGCVAVPCARVADAVKSVFEGLGDIFGTLAWSPVLGTINLVRRVKYQKEAIPNRFSASRGVKSLGLAFIYMAMVPKDFVTNLIYPKWNEPKKEPIPSKVDPKKEEPPKEGPPSSDKTLVGGESGSREPTKKAPPAPPAESVPKEPAAEQLALQPTAPDVAPARNALLADIRKRGRGEPSVNLRTPAPAAEPKEPEGIQGSFQNRIVDAVSTIHANQDPNKDKANAVDNLRSTIAFEDPGNLTPQQIRQAAEEITSEQGSSASVLASTVLTLEQLLAMHPEDPEKAQDAMLGHLEVKHEGLVGTPTQTRSSTSSPTPESTVDRLARLERERLSQQLPSTPVVEQQPGDQPSPNPASNVWGTLRQTEQGRRLRGVG